ncbi:MAG: tryptophan synthase subunit alpha [Bacteroidota bacterium]
MQNRIDRLFERKQKNILSIFLTAGYPHLIDTLSIIKILDTTDVDLLEIGIPFSDPIADGPIIQQSSVVALNNDMTLKVLFEQLRSLRTITQLPILLMGYLNSVIQFGVEEFYESCHATGIDGVILPDLPLEEFDKIHKPLAEKYNIKIVLIISPETPIERIKLVDGKSSGFLYLLSSNSTTGNFKTLSQNLFESIKPITSLPLKNKLLIGFGIKGQKEFSEACKLSSGAIIGSSFIQLLGISTDLQKDIPEFILTIKNSLKPILP